MNQTNIQTNSLTSTEERSTSHPSTTEAPKYIWVVDTSASSVIHGDSIPPSPVSFNRTRAWRAELVVEWAVVAVVYSSSISISRTSITNETRRPKCRTWCTTNTREVNTELKSITFRNTTTIIIYITSTSTTVTMTTWEVGMVTTTTMGRTTITTKRMRHTIIMKSIIKTPYIHQMVAVMATVVVEAVLQVCILHFSNLSKFN